MYEWRKHIPVYFQFGMEGTGIPLTTASEAADLLNNPQYRPPHPEINNNTPSREERLMGAK
uniref:Uncharacterized protein n=1 Tax=Rhizophora mucronata TaxID=61149 RepID=A0A2P2M6A0_RHIMU